VAEERDGFNEGESGGLCRLGGGTWGCYGRRGKKSWGERAMRLICPSCGAQYEVDADLIPETGRDVQCSACGHVWFEGPAGTVAEAAAEPEAEATAVAVAEEPEAAPAMAAEVEPEVPPTFAENPLPPVPPVRAPRRTVTPAIAEILRQEAERERAAREAEARAALERQEELPLPEPEPVAVAEPEVTAVAESVPERGDEPEAVEEPPAKAAEPDLAEAVHAAIAAEAARPVPRPPEPALSVPAAAVRPAEAPPVAPVAVAPMPRRDRLPDIEEINSTLSPASGQAMSAAERAAEGRGGRGFRLGFGLVLLVAALLALVYVYAPRIIAAVPASEPVIAPYAAAVDDGRLWLDLRLQGLVEALGTEETEG